MMALLLIPLAWQLRRLLGRGAALGAAALFTFGPSYLYFGRFTREDIYIATITLGLLVAIWLYIDRPRTYHPAIIGAVLAISFATKETTFITVFVMGSFFLFSFAVPPWREQLVGALKRAGWEGWGWFLAAFAGVLMVLFTTFLTYPEGWKGLYTGLKYWLDQHGVARGGEPWQFYPTVIVTIEWPLLLFGTIGAVSLWRRNSFFAAFLIWDFVGLADRLLDRRREVRLAGPAPAAAARAAQRRRPAGDLAVARNVALRRPRGRGGRAVLRRDLVLVDQRRRAPPTRARCSSRRSPPRTSRRSPTRSRRSRTAAAPAPRR